MLTVERESVVRVVDEDQWFEPGIRVEWSRSASEGHSEHVVPAILGAYEVLDCTRKQADGRDWLVVRLRRFGL